MDFGGQVGEILETGQSTIKNSTKSAASDFGKTIKAQITGNQNPSDQGTNEAASASNQQMSDDAAKQFLKDLYGKSNPSSGGQKNSQAHQTPVTQALGIPQKPDANAGKTPEEIAEIERLRKQLHGDYYQKLTNPPKPKEEPVAKKVEREKQESEQLGEFEKQEKAKKVKLPPSAKQGTAELNPGTFG